MGWYVNQKERARVRKEQRGKIVDIFSGITLYEKWITNGSLDEGYAVQGARASVDTAGQLHKRISATRLVAGGVVGGLIFKKKEDNRELYLMIEGDGFTIVKQVDPDKGRQAREFAARITQQGMR